MSLYKLQFTTTLVVFPGVVEGLQQTRINWGHALLRPCQELANLTKQLLQLVGLESCHIQGKLQTLRGKNDKNYFQNIKNIQGLQCKPHLFSCIKVQALQRRYVDRCC